MYQDTHARSRCLGARSVSEQASEAKRNIRFDLGKEARKEAGKEGRNEGRKE